jgi:hypothetical protein
MFFSSECSLDQCPGCGSTIGTQVNRASLYVAMRALATPTETLTGRGKAVILYNSSTIELLNGIMKGAFCNGFGHRKEQVSGGDSS